jgi:hypothetical protein
MIKNLINLDNLDNSFNISSLIDNEADSECLEWYMLEGFDRINELSRQLRTYLNYRNHMIHLRFLDTRKHKNIIKNPTVSKIERKLILLYSQYENTMNYIRTEGNTIAKSLQNLIEKIKINPNKFEINQLKKIKNISKEMWKKEDRIPFQRYLKYMKFLLLYVNFQYPTHVRFPQEHPYFSTYPY